MSDLAEQINPWRKEGDKLITTGYINEDIYRHKFCSYFSNLGLRELIIDKHGSGGTVTNRYNKKQQAIDSIWVSQGLYITEGGCLPFKQVHK